MPVEQRHGIDIAGNLSHGKAEYVYRLAERFPKADINLYGPKYDRRNGKTAWYRESSHPINCQTNWKDDSV